MDDPLVGDRPDLNETPAAVLAAERTQLLHEAVASYRTAIAGS
jgi:hypothetical protein